MPGLDGHPASSVAMGKTVSHRPAAPAAAPAGKPSAAPAAPAGTPSAAPTSSPSPAPAVATGFTETTQTVTIGTMVRTYVTFTPVQPVAARIPAIVMLHGLAVTPDMEALRDGLLPLATSGHVVLVYPAGYLETWNGVSCCGSARAAAIDDVSFVATLLRQEQANPRSPAPTWVATATVPRSPTGSPVPTPLS